ncbi:hypothetical protein [Streptomyces erythrochromogenes]|uniref:hypothetical protein n=1 Tax=Streptomyces erythrochromogenes TaxID=285574 RepID=UPI0036BECF93
MIREVLPEREAGLLIGSRHWPLLAARMQQLRLGRHRIRPWAAAHGLTQQGGPSQAAPHHHLAAQSTPRSVWDWWTVEFGDAPADAVGVLGGGGSDVPSTAHWSAYDGRAGRSCAEALRAGCACGWRGGPEYALDWATLGDRPLCEADVDLTGPLADWHAHLSLLRDKAAPLPEPLAALLVEITEQLTTTTADKPLAALRAVGMLERIAARVGERRPPRSRTTV